VHLLIFDNIALVEEDNDGLDTNLTAEQDMLTGLGHGAVSGRHDQDTTVHTSGTSDHVLHVISVTWAIDVTVVTGIGLVLNRGRVDGDTSGLLLRGLVDIGVVLEGCGALFREVLGDCGSQGGFTVINMAYTQEG